MAIKGKVVVSNLTASAAAVLSSGANDLFTVVKVLAVNYDNSNSRLVDVFLVPSGGSAGDTNQIIESFALQSKETKAMPLSGIFIPNGYSLHAKADAATAVNLVVSYNSTEQAP